MVFDKLTQGVGKIKDKVGGVVGQNRDKIDDGIDKAGDFVKDKTGNKHDDKIEAGEEKLRQGLDAISGDNTAEEPAEEPAAETPAADKPDTTPAG